MLSNIFVFTRGRTTMEQAATELTPEIKPTPKTVAFSFLRTFLSLALFIATDYIIFKSWPAVIILVTVIVIHELGHFIAMKAFGYKGINMTFIPFLGAYVSGQSDHASQTKRMIMLLAGPVPGILIGMLLLYIGEYNGYNCYPAALAFLLLNGFNLLPVSPLDGGQFLEALFFKNSMVIQISFLYFSMAVLVWITWVIQSWLLIVIVLLLFRRVMFLQVVKQTRKQLDNNNIDYDYSYDDMSDDQYAQIRDILITKSRLLNKQFIAGESSVEEARLIPYIEKVLTPYYETPLTAQQKVFYLSCYFLSFLIPLIQWSMYKNWL